MRYKGLPFILLVTFPFFAFSSGIDYTLPNSSSNEAVETSKYADADAVKEFESTKKRDPIKRIDVPNRIFEIGFSTNVDVSNNYFGASETLKEHVVIDLTKISNTISNKGFLFNFNVEPEFFINLNLRNGFHLNFSTGIESYGEVNIGKEFFDFLGRGNTLGEKMSFNLGATGDVFAYISTAIGLNIKDFHIEFAPAVYMPIFHTETNDAQIEFINENDGYTVSRASATLSMYTFTDLEPILSEKSMDGCYGSLREGWGFDIYSSIEHPLLNSLVGKIYSRIPIVPGSLSNVAKTHISADIEVEKLTSVISGIDSIKKSFDYTDLEYGTAAYKISRPFKIGAEIAWRPFGNWCAFNAMIGMGVKNPFTQVSRAFVEYNFSVNANLLIGNWNLLGLKLQTGYLNEVFRHSVAVAFNLRAIELNVGVSSASASFLPSLKLSGAAAYAMVSLGW